MGFPIIPCDLCGSQENLQRKKIKTMLQDWEREFPGRTDKIFRSLQNVVPSHLADSALFDFRSLAMAQNGEDLLFDDDETIATALRLSESEGTRIRFVRNLQPTHNSAI
jgi:tRNA 2-thiocytidine biosynthesis protein TtcA